MGITSIRKILKLFSFLLVLFMVTCLFTSCAAKKTNEGSKTDGTISSGTGKGDKAQSEDKILDKLEFPISDGSITLTYWTYNPLPQKLESMAEMPCYKELAKRSGINYKFIHPPTGQEGEHFNLMIASGEYPDLIQFDIPANYPGGVQKAIDDGLIIPLNDLIEKYSPNYRKILFSDSYLAKLAKTDKGQIYCYASFRPDPSTLTYIGPFVRKDWLDELGLDIPVTIDDWYNVLKAMKTRKGIEQPLTFMMPSIDNNNLIIGAFGVAKYWYMENNKVKYGPLEPGFKAFLETFRKWYAEGLVDPDFATNDRKTFEAKALSEKSGFFVDYSSRIRNFTIAMKEKNPNVSFVGVPNPVLNKGETPKFGHRSDMIRNFASVFVTTANKYLKETAQLLDYGYSEEGNLLFNFGIEGESYNIVNGYPKYINNYEEKFGLSFSDFLNLYAPDGPFLTDPRYFEQSVDNEAQMAANILWSKTDVIKYKLPPLTPSSEDSQKMASIMSEIKTYVDEMFLKFIYGQEPLSKYDEFVTNIKKMNIDEAIAIQQRALDAFNNR